jgi:hypothetical protein
MAAWKV